MGTKENEKRGKNIKIFVLYSGVYRCLINVFCINMNETIGCGQPNVKKSAHKYLMHRTMSII